MLLATTTQQIQAVSDAVATTNNPVVTTDWQDLTTPGETPGASNATLNGTTAVGIVAAPAANTYRTVEHITIYNADSVAHVITVIYNDNGTLRTLVSQSVPVGQTLEYIDGVGWALFNSTTRQLPTRQILTSGTSLTYTTPAGATQLSIRMVGGGGGGYGSFPGTGGAGGSTSFNSYVANGGGGSSGGITGPSGTGSNGSGAISVLRIAGGGNAANSTAQTFGTNGASSPFGGAGGGGCSPTGGFPATANSGSGGGGMTFAGGGAGEYVELIINSPSTTYTYTVGAGGTAGANGGGGGAGGAGGSGVIIVDEYY